MQHQGVVAQSRRKQGKLGEKIIDDRWLSEQRRQPGGVVFIDEPRSDIDAAGPCAYGNQDHKVLILLFGHGELDLVLCSLKLFAQRAPIVVLGKIVDAVAAPKDRLAHVELCAEVDDLFSRIFDPLSVLGLDRDVSICDENPKHEGHLGTVGCQGDRFGLKKLSPVWLALLINGRKKLSRCGDCERLDPDDRFDLGLVHRLHGSKPVARHKSQTGSENCAARYHLKRRLYEEIRICQLVSHRDNSYRRRGQQGCSFKRVSFAR